MSYKQGSYAATMREKGIIFRSDSTSDDTASNPISDAEVDTHNQRPGVSR